MMSEVVERWLKRQDEWPDLLLLDGGKTHLDTINDLLERHNLEGVFPVAALAKKKKQFFVKEKNQLKLIGKVGY